jgi:hypothetical protein
MSLCLLFVFTPLLEGPGRLGDLKIGIEEASCKSLSSKKSLTALSNHLGIVGVGESKGNSKVGGGGNSKIGGGGNTTGDKGTSCKSVGGKSEGGKMAGCKKGRWTR